MKAVVIGAGFTGIQLSRALIAENNDVVLVDRDAARVRDAGGQLDCSVVQADCTDIEALNSAGVEDADALVMLTEDDEINMITCSLVDAIYPAILKIARVHNYSYYRNAVVNASGITASMTGPNRPVFGVDWMVHPYVEAAAAISSAVAQGAVGNVTEFGGGYGIVSVPIGGNSPLIGVPLQRLPEAVEGWNFLIAYVEKPSAAAVLPTGRTRLEEGDRIGVVVDEADLSRLLGMVRVSRGRSHEMVVFGAGRVGTFVAEEKLKKMKTSMFARLFGGKEKSEQRLVIVDGDAERCRVAAERFEEARVLCGDITDEGFVQEEHLDGCDLLVATSEDYDRNLVIAAYMKSRGVGRTIALTSSSSVGGIAHKLGVDVAVPVRDTVVDSIMSHLRGQNVRAVHTVCGGAFEIVECDVSATGKAVGKALRDLPGLGGYVVLLVRQPNGGTSVPNGATRLQVGSRVVLITPAGNNKAARVFGD